LAKKMAIRKRAAHEESDDQIKLVAWCRTFYPEQADFLFAVPNGGFRRMTEAIRLKAEGVRAGFPDIGFVRPCGPYHGAFIELKKMQGGRVSKEQADWHVRLTREGYFVKVCNGLAAAQAALTWYWALPTSAKPSEGRNSSPAPHLTLLDQLLAE
jgi:adenylate cyclase class IV